jgi:rhomboid protease GluP
VTEAPEQQTRQVSLNLPVHKPVVTWILLAIIILVFGLQTLAGGSTETEVLVRLGAKANWRIAAGEYWRLFTAMFLHIGVIHLAFNGYALFAIGTELERLIGWQRYLAIYILAGLIGNLASYAFSFSLAAGASGAIFGLIGALAAYFLMHRKELGSWGQRRLINIGILIAINLFLGFTQPGIDNMAHMGGLVTGLGLGWAMAPRYAVDPVALKLVDTNRFSRYWPALAAAVLVFIGGTVLATTIQRDSIQSSLWRVELAVEQENWEEVVREVDHVLAEDPDEVDSYLLFQKGLAHNYLDQLLPAAQAYEAAIELDPGDSASRWNLALTYLDLGELIKSELQFEAYLQLEPGEAEEVQPYLDEINRLAP